MKMKAILLKAIVMIAIVMGNTFTYAESENASQESEFSIEELKGHMYFLASGYLQGRVSGEAGFDIASEYVKSQFKSAGLKPFILTENGDSSFMQSFVMTRKDYYADNPLRVKYSDEEKSFEYDIDFKITGIYPGGLDNGDKEVIFLGYGIEEPDENWNDYDNIDVTGKPVIILNGAPTKKGEAVLSEEKHALYSSFNGLNQKLMNLMAKKPSAIMLVKDEMLEQYYNNVQSNCHEFSLEYDGQDLRADFSDAIYRLMIIKPELAQAMLEKSKMDLENIKKGKLLRYRTGILPDVKINMDIRMEESLIDVANICGYVEGTDSLLSKEFLVIGAHLDHVPNFTGKVNYGADDNASGVSLIMELADEIAENPLKRSVVFVAYTGEEGGLHGSRHFVNYFPHEKEQIATALNFDCVGRSGVNASQRFETFILDAAKVCPDMIPIVEQINEETVNFKLVYEMENRWGTSDQESFVNEGIPVVDFFNGGTRDLHSPRDVVEKIDWEYLQRMCILGQAVAEELGNMQERICEVQEM